MIMWFRMPPSWEVMMLLIGLVQKVALFYSLQRFCMPLLLVRRQFLIIRLMLEILVSTVDVVLGSGNIDEKFLGFTLFALVPNTTEFVNAISFALNGNIALR
jgi:Ca2+/H+ antiporter